MGTIKAIVVLGGIYFMVGVTVTAGCYIGAALAEKACEALS